MLIQHLMYYTQVLQLQLYWRISQLYVLIGKPVRTYFLGHPVGTDMLTILIMMLLLTVVNI